MVSQNFHNCKWGFMAYTIFKIGSFSMHGYGLMIGIGIIAAVLMATLRAKGAGLSADKVWGMILWSTLVGFGGGKLLYIIVEHDRIATDPWGVLGPSGFVVYGGLIAGISFSVLYAKLSKISFSRYIDLLVPSLAVGQGFGRLGCLMAGCCYGREAHAGEWGIIFPHGCDAPADVALIPTQVYMSIGDFAIAAILLIIDYSTRNKGRTPGMLIVYYLLMYSVGRFLIEFLRNDVRGSVGALSTSQFIAIFMVAAAIIIFFVQRKRYKTGSGNEDNTT